MGCPVGEVSRVNAFALVSYIPGPLGRFLDGLRRELVPACTAQSHVTILPPRVLEEPPDQGWSEAAEVLRNTPPLEIELGDVEIFPVSQAIYLSLARGADAIERLHHRLNAGQLEFAEPFTFHPHVTLAQEVKPERLDEVVAHARKVWQEWNGARRFLAERLVFVQNGVSENGLSQWIDLAKCDLGHPCESWHWTDDGSLSRTSPFGPAAVSPATLAGRGGAGSR